MGKKKTYKIVINGIKSVRASVKAVLFRRLEVVFGGSINIQGQV